LRQQWADTTRYRILHGKYQRALFLAPVFPFAALERQIRVYQEACAKHGHTPHIIYLRPIYLGDNPAQVRRECEPYLLNFLAYGSTPFALISQSKEELQKAGYGFYASALSEPFPQLSYDELVVQEWAFVGTPAQVIDKIGWLQEKAGITEFDILSNYGGMPHWQSLKQQELFAQHVIPVFRGRASVTG
jgi:alkanesulfonate monooxygenase SsuD/methylene tetrahydromethanopterin reductase-like flavin-dependent oxidoreductase (luciferase family)